MCSAEPAWQHPSQARHKWALRPHHQHASVSLTLRLSFAAEVRHCNELPLDSHWLHRKPLQHSARWNRRPNPGTGTSRHTRIFTHRPSEARIRRSCPDRFTGYLFIVWSKRRDVRAQISRRHLKQVQYRAKRGRRSKKKVRTHHHARRSATPVTSFAGPPRWRLCPSRRRLSLLPGSLVR